MTAAAAAAAEKTGLNLGGKIFFGGLCVGTFGLGCWQTRRFFDKQMLVKQREEDLRKDPISFGNSNMDATSAADEQGLQRRVVQGQFRHEKQILVGPRGPPPGAMSELGPSSGRSGGGMSSSPQGYYIMTPLVTASGTTVVVNRGWIPRHFLTSDQPWKKPTEPVKVVGIPFKGEKPRFITPDHELHKQPMQMFWVDQSALEQVAGGAENEEIVMLTQVQTSDDEPGWPVRPSVETVGEFKTTPAIHAGYAATWFGLSGAGLVMTRKLITRGRA